MVHYTTHSARPPANRGTGGGLQVKRGTSIEPISAKSVNKSSFDLRSPSLAVPEAGGVSPGSKSPLLKNLSGDTSNVVVGVRCRKFKPSEDGDSGVAVHMDDEGNVAVQVPGKASHAFAFDKCFQPDVTQKDVYEQLGMPLVKNALNGYNSSLLAYGATGSGKTYSMFNTSDELLGGERGGGEDSDGMERSMIATTTGLVPRLLAKILEENESGGGDSSGSKPHVDLSLDIVEVYLEECFDLVHDRTKIVVAGTNRDGYYCVGLKPTPVRNFQHAMELIAKAQKNRSVAATALNDYSSRAHTLVIAEVRTKHDDGWRTAKLLFADLAGSERIKVAKTEAGKALDEARNINLSLMALGSCVEAAVRNYQIGAPDRNIPHFRDSTLTKLLKECIGGNSRTSILVTVAPGTEHLNNTVHSLRFGNRAKDLKNNAAMNLVKEKEAEAEVDGAGQKEAKKAANVILAVQQAMHLRLNNRLQQLQREEAKARFNLHKDLKAEYVKMQRMQMQAYIQLRQALALLDNGNGGVNHIRDAVKLPMLDARQLRKAGMPSPRRGEPNQDRKPKVVVKMPEIQTKATTRCHSPKWAKKDPRPWEKAKRSELPEVERRGPTVPKAPTWAKKNPRPWEQAKRSKLPDVDRKGPTKPKTPNWAHRDPNAHDHLARSRSVNPNPSPVKLPNIEPKLRNVERQEGVKRRDLQKGEDIDRMALVASDAKGKVAMAKKTAPKESNNSELSPSASLNKKKADLHPDSPNFSGSMNSASPLKKPHPPPEPKEKRKSIANTPPEDDDVDRSWIPMPPSREKEKGQNAPSRGGGKPAEVPPIVEDIPEVPAGEQSIRSSQSRSSYDSRRKSPVSSRSRSPYSSRDSRRSTPYRSRSSSYDSRKPRSIDSRDSRRSSYDSRRSSRSRSRSRSPYTDSRPVSRDAGEDPAPPQEGKTIVKIPTPPPLPKCDHCHKVMEGDMMRLSMENQPEVTLHPECCDAYRAAHSHWCAHCNKPMLDGYVELTEPGAEKPVKLHEECVKAYQMATRPKCTTCDKKIMDQGGVTYMNDQPYHAQCAMEEQQRIQQENARRLKAQNTVHEASMDESKHTAERVPDALEVEDDSMLVSAVDHSFNVSQTEGKKKKGKKGSKKKKEKQNGTNAGDGYGDVPDWIEDDEEVPAIVTEEQESTPTKAPIDFTEQVKKEEEELAKQRAEEERLQREEQEKLDRERQERVNREEEEAAAKRRAEQEAALAAASTSKKSAPAWLDDYEEDFE